MNGNIDLFNQMKTFFSGHRLSVYKKREILLRPDDTPTGVYYVKKGYIRLYSLSAEGQEFTLIIFQPGDVFPLMWAVNDTPNKQYLEALTTVEVWKAPREELLTFLQANPAMFSVLTSKILLRFNGLLERMEYLIFGDAYAKVASILSICADRFGEKEGSKIKIKVPLTHKDIASLIGVTRETVSIEMKKLEDTSVVVRQKGLLLITDNKKLHKASQMETLA